MTFCMKFLHHKALKWTEMILWEMPCLEVFESKGPTNGLKMWFLKLQNADAK